jgi:hypothetical protein
LGRSIINAVVAPFKILAGEGSGLGNIFQTVGRIIGVVFAGYVNYLSGVVKVITGVFQIFGKGLEVFVTIIKMVVNIIRGALMLAFDVWMNKLGPISTALRNVANGVRNAFSSIASFVSSAFNNVGKAVEGFINFAIGAVNILIDAYNKLAGILPNVSRVANIAEFRFNALSSAASNAAEKTYNAASASGFNAREAERQGTAVATATDAIVENTNFTAANTGATGGNTSAKEKNAKATDKQADKLKKYQGVFNEHVERLKSATAEIQKSYDDMAKSVSDAIFGVFDVGNLDPNRVGDNGEKVGGTWLDGLQSRATEAIEFSKKVAEVIKLGLKPGSPAFEAVMSVTKQQGTGLLDELIAGGVEAVNQSVAIVDSVKDAADKVGVDAAQQFHGTGLTLAKETEAAFAKRFGEGGPGYNKINRLMTALSRSLTRTAYIDVVTRYRNEGGPGSGTLAVGATGGIVNRPTFALIGEAGPEAVVPLNRTPGNLPLPLTGRGNGGSTGETTINVTVNAGMSTDGAEVGRQIVDALKQYERRNGPVYVAA